MRVQVAIPEKNVKQPVLDAALEAVTRLNEEMIADGDAPLFEQCVNRVRWRPEPPGQEHFDNASEVLARGHGDCDDLAPWHAASLRATGEDPGARATVVKSGPKTWHAIVERSDGRLEDPSAAAGMPVPSGARAPTVPMLATAGDMSVVGSYLLRPQIALRPAYGEWQARADLPWQWRTHAMRDEPSETDWAMTALHSAPLASTALVGAIMGAIELAEANDAGDDEHLERLCCLSDAAQGWPYEDLAEHYGHEHAAAATSVIGGMARIGFGLGDIVNFATDKLLPVAASIVPGASLAVPYVQRLIHGGGGGGAPAAAAYAPQAPQAYPAAYAPQGYAPQAYPAAYPAPYAQGPRIVPGGPGQYCIQF